MTEKNNTQFGGFSGEMLRNIVSKIEKLEEEKREIAEFITDAFREAKSQGFDTKALREVLKQRKLDREELAEQEELVDIYKHALGMAFDDEDEDEDGEVDENSPVINQEPVAA